MRRINPQASARQIRRSVQKSYESYARYYIETFRLPLLNSKQIQAGVAIEGFEHIENALKLGNGVILALPHLGGWEWSGRWLIQRGHNLNAVVEKLESRRLFEMFLQLRKSYGVQVIPLDEHAGVAVQQALAKNEIVALLSDRDIQGSGIEVEFSENERRFLLVRILCIANRRCPRAACYLFFKTAGRSRNGRSPRCES